MVRMGQVRSPDQWNSTDVLFAVTDFTCSLAERQLNPATRTWLIDNDALDDLGNDLQALINCTQEGDMVLFNVSETITPASRIVIPWRLTISGAVENTALEAGIFPVAVKRVRFACPEGGIGVFLIKYISFCLH